MYEIRRDFRIIGGQSMVPTPAGAPPSTLKTNLISFWELDEASGTRVDAHTGGNDLTDNNTVTQTTGWAGAGNAAQFTSANSESLSRASNSSLQRGGKSWSFAGSFRMDTTVDGATLVGKGGSFGNREFAILDKFTTGHRLVFRVYDNAGVTLHDLAANTFGNLSTGTDYFYVCTYDNATGGMAISVNNSAQDTTTITGPITSSTGDFAFGTFEAAGGSFFNGRQQRGGLWDKVLSPSEITQLWNGGTPLSYAQL